MRKRIELVNAKFWKEGQEKQEICLPHTWNNLDGQDGGGDYWRGNGHYEILLPDPTADKRQYIEFGAANHRASVYCNGGFIGEHKGGFSAFRFELTPFLKQSDNVVTVIVNNEKQPIYPQRADFTFCGGLYREVYLLEVDDAHIDLMKDGASGVFVTAQPNGAVRVDTFTVNSDACQLEVLLTDAEGNIVAQQKQDALAHTPSHLEVQNPHLWQGIADPYCYHCTVNLWLNDVIVDSVSTDFGFRSFRVDPETGFYLNGISTPLRGVAKHQDRKDKGWAASHSDLEEDLNLILEMGANTIRLGHYQHPQYFLDLCDKSGLVLWAEIPFISQFMPEQEAFDNTMSQMTELIAQNYNHPSICCWGIQNEITIGGWSEGLIKNMYALATLVKKLDPFRLSTMAHIGGVSDYHETNYLTDVVSFNYYFGWYSGKVQDTAERVDTFHKINPQVCYGISEYGADCNVEIHSAKPFNHDYSEEYGAYYHHEMLKIISERPYLWATHAWIMFDFAADARNEGGMKGINAKGLVTQDRKYKKDSYYVYQAYWTKKPMVHIAGKGFAKRAPDENAFTIYTNEDAVSLYVNGELVGKKQAVDHAVVFENIALNSGMNTLCAVTDNAKDTAEFELVSESWSDYVLSDIEDAMQAGNWFDSERDDTDNEEIQVLDGFYSVQDKVGDLFTNEQLIPIVKGWIMSSDHLDNGEKMLLISRLHNWGAMWGDRTIYEIKMLNESFTPLEKARLNRALSKIRK